LVTILRDFIGRLGENILKEGEYIKFRNERKKFPEFLEAIATRLPEAMTTDRVLNEPYKSVAFLVTIGQRPATSLLILKTLLRAGEEPLNGKEIGEKLAEELNISPMLTTKGGNYKDRVGDLISTFVKIGILEPVFSDKSDHFEQEGFRIRESAVAEVKAFVDCIESKNGVLYNLKPSSLQETFKRRFDRKLKYVIKSGSKEKQRFSIGKIIKSLLDPRLGIPFDSAIRIIEEVEPKLKPKMKTLDIQSMLYKTLKELDEKAAQNYRLIYPEISSVTTSDGEIRVVNYSFVKTLIKKEVKLKLTRNLLDKFASTVYNVITRNPKNFRDETAIREHIDTLIHSECMHIRSDASFVRNHLEKAVSALEGCYASLQSDEVNTARGLFGKFLEQICPVTLTQLGYLPLKDTAKNVDLVSNLMKQETVKKELKDKFQLNERDIAQLQTIKSMTQKKDTANRKSLEKMVNESKRLIDISRHILKSSTREPESMAIEISDTIVSTRITTGYTDLDNVLFGGIPENYAVILTSPSCDERDLLIKRFLEAGTKENQITFLVTIDASGAKALAEEFWSNLYLFICNPEADAIIENLTNVFKLRGVENLTDISIALNSAIRKLDRSLKKPRRAYIGIISDVLLQHHALSTRRWLAALIPTLKSRGFTTLAVMNPHMHSPQEVHAILDLFDGEIDIYKKKTQKGLKRFLRIEKMYDQEYLETELSLKKERIQKMRK
jgi:KaiC/GvpD/RAD55 family RecA-like ATPase